MKKALVLGLTLSLVGGVAHAAKSELFGRAVVIDENGKDISRLCSSISKTGLLKQKVKKAGTMMLKQITCRTGGSMYRIKKSDLAIDIAEKGTATYVGDITFKLLGEGSSKGTYTVKIEDNFESSKALYNGKSPITKSIAKSGDAAKEWSKHYLPPSF